jgi:hypothetical protein
MKNWVKLKVQDEWKNGLDFDVASQRHAAHVPGVRFLHFQPDPESGLQGFGLRRRSRTHWNPSTTFPGDPFCVPRYFHTSPDTLLNQENQLNQKNQLKPKKRAIILRLPESLVDRLDTVISDLQMPSRSFYLRRSIERALDFSETREIPLLNDPALQRTLAR